MAQQYRFDGVTLAYDAAAPVLEDVSFELMDTTWTGIVGENGSGKTTLLRALVGELTPALGRIQRPDGLSIGYCPQEASLVNDAIRGFSWAWDKSAVRLREALRLDVEALERFDTLSPGERRRWQVGAALYETPDVLILDEPTNHLDSESRSLLRERLTAFRGRGVLVSHDRSFLDALVTRVVWLKGGRAQNFDGNFSRAHDSVRHLRRELLDKARGARDEEARLRRALADGRRRQGAAEQQRSTRARMRNADDSDVRAIGAQFRADSAAARLSRNVETMRRRHEDALEARRDVVVEKERGASVAFAAAPGAPSQLVDLVLDELVVGERVLARHVSRSVRRDSRIWLRGPNGSGKSTLLRALVGAWRHAPERLLYMPQRLGEQAEEQLTKALAELTREQRGELCAVAACWGLDPTDALAGRPQSPGEARKLWLAEGVVRGAWCLLLDEPENHFDLPAIERLSDALGRFEGALVLVTHDETLGASITNETWEMPSGSPSHVHAILTSDHPR